MAAADTGAAARWGDRIPGASSVRTLWLQRLLGITFALLVTGGLVGLYRYVDNYWLYRGYAPPKDPAWVVERGTTRTIGVTSPAVGGRRQQVIVYLPPGYASHPARRYPVFYLLHGSPGLPNAILLTVKAGVVEDELVARGRVRPMILVMPFGSPSRFTDTEWANGVGRASGWETFLARDVVRAIDARYRTIRSGAGRALGGLSEGGYGSLNIGLHHPREFHVLESWSGYVRADPIVSVFGRDPARLRRNSPAVSIRSAGPVLRRHGVTIWFYSSRGDLGLPQNEAFAAQLARLGVHSRFLVVPGGHDWRTWRDNFPAALQAASRGLGRG